MTMEIKGPCFLLLEVLYGFVSMHLRFFFLRICFQEPISMFVFPKNYFLLEASHKHELIPTNTQSCWMCDNPTKRFPLLPLSMKA